MTLPAALCFRAAPRSRRPARSPGRRCSTLPRPGRRPRRGKPEPGAKLTVMRWKRFVPSEDDAFNAMVAAFKAADRHRDERVQRVLRGRSAEGLGGGQHRTRASTWSGACTRCRSCFRPKCIKMNDVADYLGKKYGGWTDAAADTCKQRQRLARHSRRDRRRLHDLPQVGHRQGRLQRIPDGFPGLPCDVQGD